MIKRFLVIAAVITLCAAWTHGKPSANFYVDSVNGNNANPGTSIALAFKDLTALPTLTSGQTVCLVAGSYWRQFLNLGSGSQLANFTLSGCTNGVQPVIDASDVISTGIWSKTGGLSVTYNTTALPAPAAFSIGIPWVQVFENGNYLGYESSQASVDANAGTYTVSSMTTSTATIYVHASDGTNPATNGKTYEYTARPNALYLNAGSGDTISNINFKRGGATSGALQIIGDGSAPTITGITCTQGGRHCTQMPTGTISDSVFNDAYDPTAEGSASQLVIFESVGSGHSSLVSNVAFNRGATVTAINAATENTPAAMISHAATGVLGGITITGGSVLNQNPLVVSYSGFSFQEVPSVTMSGTTFTEVQAAISPQTGQAWNTSNLVYNSAISTNAFLGELNNGGSWTDNGSVACVANVRQGVFRNSSGSTPASLSLNNFTFYAQATQNNSVALTIDLGNNLNFSVNNSIIDETAISGGNAYNSGGTGEVYTGNNNHFPGVAHWVLNSTSESTLANWRTLSGQDAASDTTGSAAASCGVAGFSQFVVIF